MFSEQINLVQTNPVPRNMSSQPANSPDVLDSPPPGSPPETLSPTQPISHLQNSETHEVHENTNDSDSDGTYQVQAALWTEESSHTARFSPIQNDIQPWNPDHNSHNELGEGSNQFVPFNVPHETDSINIVSENNSNSLPPILGLNSEDSTSRTTDKSIRKSDLDNEEPPAKIRKVVSLNKSFDEQDGETCPICLDCWGNSGEHRLVALKCGHLFGSQCVERWLKAQAVKERTCPTCKSRASIRDIRPIYARRLIAADTSEITSLQRQVETLQAEKSRTELELQKTKISHRTCLTELENLRKTLTYNTAPQRKKTVRFSLEKNLEICKDGGCRVLAYNCRTYDLYVSQKSTNSLFPGFGVRCVGCVDYKLGQMINLHPKPIRDISYSQPLDLLMSASLDGSARLLQRGLPSATISTGVPLWSCTWDSSREKELYLGGVGGSILRYDLRHTAAPLDRLSAPSDVTPVAAVRSTEFGLLSCQLNSCWLWTPGTSARALPAEGPFLSMAYDAESRRIVLACRPKGLARSKLTVNKLQLTSEGEVTCEVEQTLYGSLRATLMSRVSWVKGGGTWLAAHSESDSALILHGLDETRSLNLPATEPALDVTSMQLNGDTILATLSESRLRVYKAVCTNL